MLGAIVGDIIGSRFEWHNKKSKDFRLFDRSCRPTDDSVMSLAVAKAIIECHGNYENLSGTAILFMQKMGRKYKDAGYGGNFIKWIWADNPQPYNSYGNGSAMRVGPCGYAAKTLEEAKELSGKVTVISHDHPEGIKGAEAIAVAVFLAREGKTKEEIKSYITEKYYPIDFTIDQIRSSYTFDVSCQGSVPVALEAFFESNDFIDAIRNAVSVGGDSDTIACMAGCVAEAFYGIPEDVIYETIDYLDSCGMEILYTFEKNYPSKVFDASDTTIFDILDDAVDKLVPKGTPMQLDEILPGNAARVFIDPEAMIPDFSSFDKKKPHLHKTHNDKEISKGKRTIDKQSVKNKLIPVKSNETVVDPDKSTLDSYIKPVDNFTITEWPGKVDETSLICDVAIQNTSVPLSSCITNLVPYSQSSIERIEYFDVFDLDKEEKANPEKEKVEDYADRLDKGVAVASGLLSGIIDVLFVGEFSLDRAKQYGEKDVESIVKKTAQKFGYKGNDIKGAIEHLETKFPFASDSNVNDFGGARQHHLWDFSHHFSIFGLLCSILTQFTGKVIGTNKEGMLIIRDVSDQQLIGKNTVEKLFFGTVIWFFHMVSDMAGSSECLGRGAGIPGPIISLIKTVSAIPLFRTVKIKETDFYTWVSRLFGGAYFKKRDENGKLIDSVPFDLRTEIGILHEGSKQLVPVLINEAIVRSFYFIRRTHREISNKNICSISDLSKIEVQNILPFNTPAIRRMCTISSGVFCAVDMIDALIRAIAEENPAVFFMRINYVGIARFVVAIGIEAAAYLRETQVEREKAAYRKYRLEQEIAKLDWFTLNADQTQVMLSLERQSCIYDIEHTKDEKKKAIKSKWLSAWTESTIQGLRLSTESEQYFLEADDLFEKFKNVYQSDGKEHGLLMVLEAVTFQPYFPTKEQEVAEYKGIHLDHHFMGTVFLQRQHLVQKSEVDNLRSGYGWYYDLLSGKIRNRWIIGAGTLALTILTGGLALHFAPAIAVALVGNTALHGAALTSFSLAAIGGGSLAVGGLGMAGGTLIIAGGGGVVGLLSGATLTSVTSMLLLESDGYVLNECSKLLGFSEKVLLKEENAYSKITELARTISVKTEYLKQLCRTLKRDMDSIKEQKEKQKQEQKVKVAEKSIGYLIETSKHLYELANRIPKEKR